MSYAPKGKLPAGLCLIIIGTEGKTDANDADGLALLAEAGFFREVRVKSWEAMRVRALIGGRAQLIGISTELSNQIRGVMKTFGLIVPKAAAGSSRPMSAPCSRGRRR